MPITETELRNTEAPFVVKDDHTGTAATVIGFTDNDPLGVGGGIFPDMPTAHFKGGGWLLVADLVANNSIVGGA